MIHKLKDLKLIVIDIDGTLVDVNGNVGTKTVHLARELKNHGIYCTLSSARSYHYSAHIAEELNITIPFVTLDGALIKDLKGNAVYRGILKRKIIDKIVKVSESNYGKVSLCDENYLFVTPRNSVIKEFRRLSSPVKEVSDYSETNNILEILIYCDDKTILKIIKESLGFPLSLGLSVSMSKSPTYEHYLLTIKKKGSNKLASVKRLVKHLGLKKKNIAVIGDWHNDMPLFEYGAYNIAVKNAVPELKRKADYVTQSTNEEDAVGEVLELVHNYKQKTAI